MNETRRSAGTDPGAAAEGIERSDPSLEGEDDPPEADDLSKDELFGVLKNRRRRQTLEYLKRNGGFADRGDVAEYIAAEENGVEIDEISCSQRKRVYISLHQCHLPKMADVGVVTYDQTQGTIELEPAADLLFPYLELDPRSATAARRTAPDPSGGDSSRGAAPPASTGRARARDDSSADESQGEDDDSSATARSADGRAESRPNGVSASVRWFAGSIAKRL